MISPSFQKYSSYVSVMKIVLPIGIVLVTGLSIGWPYFRSLDKDEITFVDPSHPEILENRMIQPHYASTDNKGQPYQVNAEWAKQRTESLADLTGPHGSMTMEKGESFEVKANNGVYDSQGKVLGLEGEVVLTSTDGYHAKTDKAQITLDTKLIEGNAYFEGEGPTGSIRGKHGFKVESHPQGKVLTLKGPSRVVITRSVVKKIEAPDV